MFRMAARHMREKGGGQIITITTTWPSSQWPSTAALTSLTKRGLNLCYARAGDRVCRGGSG